MASQVALPVPELGVEPLEPQDGAWVWSHLTARPKPLFLRKQSPAWTGSGPCSGVNSLFHTGQTLRRGARSNRKPSWAAWQRGWAQAGCPSPQPCAPASASGALGQRHGSSAQAALSWASFSFMRWKRFLIAGFDRLGECKIPLRSCWRAVPVHPFASPALCVAVCKLRVQMTGK